MYSAYIYIYIYSIHDKFSTCKLLSNMQIEATPHDNDQGGCGYEN